MRAYRTNYVSVDLRAMAGNVSALKKRLPASTAIIAIVKADAYGHGLVRASETFLSAGCDMLGVAIAEEGITLREAGIKVPVLVLGTLEHSSAGAVVENDLIQTAYLPEHVYWLEHAAAACGKTAYIHAKIDTGMGRIGARTSAEVANLLEAVYKCKNVSLSGAFTHFAAADQPDDDFTQKQNILFKKLIKPIAAEYKNIMLHAANSAAALTFPEAIYNAVRAGITLYGYPQIPGIDGFTPLLKWVTRGVYLKKIETGDAISYNCTYKAAQPIKVMTLPVGYGDGYKRQISNRGHVLIRGMRAPVIGRVCMDQTMIDVTHVPGAEMGDEVVLLGSQRGSVITAEDMAQWCDTISHEILLSISPRVPKVYEGGVI